MAFISAEEYTKISTPRQEVLFKKGSIGKKRSSNQGSTATPTTSAGSEGLVNSADNDDSLNGNTAFPTTPTSPTGDGESLHYNAIFFARWPFIESEIWLLMERRGWRAFSTVV